MLFSRFYKKSVPKVCFRFKIHEGRIILATRMLLIFKKKCIIYDERRTIEKNQKFSTNKSKKILASDLSEISRYATDFYESAEGAGGMGVRRFLFLVRTLVPRRMISDGLEIGKQSEREITL